MSKEQLKLTYEKACTAYVKAFCKKHSLDFPEWCSEIDGTYNISEWYLYFGDIKTDIDMDVQEGLIFSWYDDSMEHHYVNPNENINYANYVKGLRFDIFKKETHNGQSAPTQ